jgi:hypothetical protein
MRAQGSCLVAFAVVACGGQLASAPDAATDSANAPQSDTLAVPHCAFAGFAPQVSYATASAPQGIFVVDFDGNRSLDFVVDEWTDWNYTPQFFANNGIGSFRPAASTGASTNSYSGMAAADFNGDGVLDLASQADPLANTTPMGAPGTLVIDFGLAGGGFASQPVTYAAPRTYGDCVVGDFNGDGHPDLAVAAWNTVERNGGLPVPGPGDFAFYVYINAGDGTFGAASSLTSTSPPGIVAGDFNGDGLTDLANIYTAGTYEGAGIGIYFNAGEGTFASEVTYATNSFGEPNSGLAAADFNGDGLPDLATFVYDTATSTTQLVVLLSAGGGRFQAPVASPAVGLPNQVVVGDFNGDGVPDLAVGPDVTIYRGNGDGTFGLGVSYAVGVNVTSITVGDFNGDGISDIATTTDSSSLGTGPGYPLGVNVMLSQCVRGNHPTQ